MPPYRPLRISGVWCGALWEHQKESELLNNLKNAKKCHILSRWDAVALYDHNSNCFENSHPQMTSIICISCLNLGFVFWSCVKCGIIWKNSTRWLFYSFNISKLDFKLQQILPGLMIFFITEILVSYLPYPN